MTDVLLDHYVLSHVGCDHQPQNAASFIDRSNDRYADMARGANPSRLHGGPCEAGTPVQPVSEAPRRASIAGLRSSPHSARTEPTEEVIASSPFQLYLGLLLLRAKLRSATVVGNDRERQRA